MADKVYLLEHLGCANCAAKIERDVSRLPQVDDAVIVFATKQLRVKTEQPEGLREQIEQIARSYEPDISVHDRDGGKKNKAVFHRNASAAQTTAGEDDDAYAHHYEGAERAGELKHSHEHHHDHEGDCCCGHEHHHDHEDDCCCGHDHAHNDAVPQVRRSGTSGGETRTYRVENLDCANCGAKIERKIAEMDGVSDAVLTFATKQLRVTAPDHSGLAARMQQTARTVEPDVSILAPQEAKPAQHTDGDKKELIELIAGALCMAAGIALESVSAPVSLAAFVIGYLILGREIVWTAVRNLFSGHVFDENFLMTVATIGAFVIGEYPEAVGVMLFFRVGELFEHRAVEKSRSQIMDAVDMRPETVQLEDGGEVVTVPAEQAEPGDVLVVRPGDRVPLDGEVLEGESFLDTSAVTGEPVPVRVTVGDELVSGCVNTSGLLRMRVTKPLSESMVTRILDAVENAAASKPQIDRFITRFARVYTPVVVAVAALTAIVPSIVTGDWNHWVYTALTFLVISCPCALVLSVPLAFFSGIGTASRRGILFKGGVSLERLAQVRAAALDKTGTITKGSFTVTDIQPQNGTDAAELLRMAACCELSSTHPIGVSIVEAAQQKGCSMDMPHAIQEIAGRGVRAALPEGTVLCGSRSLLELDGVSIPELPQEKGATQVYLACNGSYIGRILISDSVKDDAQPAIARLHQLGVSTAMLTGDAADSADAIAKQTEIDTVYAHLLPQEKLERLHDVREKYGPVLFVGDGINDAPVLAGADVGAAMGSGADAAIEAADVVFLTGELSAIPQAISLARQTARIAKQNIVFALVIKIAIMLLGLMGIASMWLAVFADTGVAMLCVLNSIRLLYKK